MRRIAIDFDGVIHRYSDGYQKGDPYDIPMPGAFETMRRLISQGFEIYIFTVRPPQEVVKWLGKHGWDLEIPRVTNEKLPAIAYIDDRAIRFTNWADITKYFL